MRLNLKTCLTAATAVMLTASLAYGLHPKLSLEEIAQNADLIFVGTVTRQNSHYNAQRTMIETDVTFTDVRIEHETDRATPHRARAGQMPLAPQFLRQLGGALAGPTQRESGLPRVTGSTNRSKRSSKSGLVSARRLRPPPTLRMREPNAASVSTSRPDNSANPLRMVFGERPVALLTARTPPHPYACASVAAQHRRMRSSIMGAKRTVLRFNFVNGSGILHNHLKA